MRNNPLLSLFFKLFKNVKFLFSMKNIFLILFLIIPFFGFVSDSFTSFIPKGDQFRRDYNNVAIYDKETEKWGKWINADHTFVFNYNTRNDVLHVKANGDNFLYKKIGNIEEGSNNSGQKYQYFEALDEEGIPFTLLLYEDSEVGLMMIYNNIKIQFANF